MSAYDGVLVDVFELGASGGGSDSIARKAEALREYRCDSPLVVSAPGLGRLELPASVSRALGSMLHEAGQGHTVALVTTAEEISTGAAAKLLGVSRPHVVKLIETGMLRGRTLRRHRRVRLADVLEFKREMERKHCILDDLSRDAQELGLYPDVTSPRARA